MTEAAAPQPQEPLQGRLSRGLRWSVVNTLVLRLGSLATGAVLLRIIAPAEYGVYGSALIVVTALLSMNELGVSLAIVRRGSDVRTIAPTVATLALATSTALYLFTWAAAPLVATALNAPAATTMIRVLATCVLIDAVSAVPAQVLAREFAQGRRFIIDLVAFVVGTTLSIVLAVADHGAWALVWGFLLTNVVAGVLAVALSPVAHRLRFRPVGGTGAVGLRTAPGRLQHAPLRHDERRLPRRRKHPRAHRPRPLPQRVHARVLAGEPRLRDGASGHPLGVLPRGRRRGRCTSTGLPQRVRGVLVLTIPMCTGLAVFAEQIIGTLYGERWVPAAAALEPLAVLALARVIVELTYDYLVSADRNASNLVLQSVWIIALVPALVIGAHLDGIRGVGRAHALVAVTVVAAAIYIALRRTGIHARDLAAAASGPVLAAAPMAAVGWWCTRLVGRAAACAPGRRDAGHTHLRRADAAPAPGAPSAAGGDPHRLTRGARPPAAAPWPY